MGPDPPETGLATFSGGTGLPCPRPESSPTDDTREERDPECFMGGGEIGDEETPEVGAVGRTPVENTAIFISQR